MDLGEEFGRAARAFQAGDLRTAERVCGKILRKSPRHIGALSLLAAIEFRGGDLDAGIRHTKAVLRLKSDDVDALFNLGHALTLQRHPREALDCYDKLLMVRPDHAPALGNRGAILLLLGRDEEALASFQKAFSLEPNSLAVGINVGLALVELKRHEEALAAFEQALARDPGNELLLFAKGGVLEELNRADDAIVAYQQILSKNPNLAKARFALCKAQLPVLYRDADEIAARRAAYGRCLQTIAGDIGTLDFRRPGQEFELKPPFYLPYQAQNDRDLQKTFGVLACNIISARLPDQVAKAPRQKTDKPLKVGIVSGFFREHSNWKIPIKGWIAPLDRKRFRVFGYYTGQLADAQTELAKSMCERFVQGRASIEEWRKEILSDAPDILIYPEVGMEPMAAQLAMLRLAPVQCNAWGHPTTSGFPTMDYFLSSDLMEPENGQDHYSERLVRLPNLGIYYEPPAIAQIGRARSGPQSGVRFWCGQATPKYLPQYDAVFPRIANEAGDCRFVFIESQVSAGVSAQFRERLAKAFSAVNLDASRYCQFLPRMKANEFAAALGQCDIFLDSIGWSGCNSTLESLPYDIPIVTLPGAMMRGRHSMAILKMMGVTSTIVGTTDDYIDIAARLARDPEAQQEIRAQIAANKSKIYGDSSVVAALEDFLETAAQTS